MSLPWDATRDHFYVQGLCRAGSAPWACTLHLGSAVELALVAGVWATWPQGCQSKRAGPAAHLAVRGKVRERTRPQPMPRPCPATHHLWLVG